MKYFISSNQKQALELGITNINQALIFDLLTGLSTWATPEIIDGQVFYWASRTKIVDELPLLSLKPDTVYRHLVALKDLGVIDYEKAGKKDCIRLTPRGKSYYVGNESELSQNSEMNPGKLGNESEKNSEMNPTYKNTNNINTTKDIMGKKFSRPTAEQVKLYGREIGFNIDENRFIDFYESKGWMIGKNKMKDWKAAVRTWKHKEEENKKPQESLGISSRRLN